MTMHERVSGVWKEITQPAERVSGVWKDFTEGWVNVSGTWKQFYSSVAISLPPVTETIIAAPSAAGVRVNRNGSYQSGTGTGGTTVTYGDVAATAWVDPDGSTVGDAYHCRLVVSSGSLSVGTAGTWLALTSDRLFEVNTATGDGFVGATMQISSDGGSTILETGSVNLTASPL